MSFPIYRRVEPNVQLVEFNCVPFVEEMMYTPLGLYKPRQTERSSRISSGGFRCVIELSCH